MENKKSKFEDIIERDGKILYMTHGISMQPMLKECENPVVISKIERKPQKYDVVLYKRGSKYILHRIVKIKNGNYVIRGDNCYNNEYDITDSNIIGVLSGYYKGEKYVDCQKSLRYKIYSRVRCADFAVRKPWIWLKGRIRRILKGKSDKTRE